MNWNDFTAIRVRIEYADLAKMNRIRGWARRNNAIVQASRYTKNAYEGWVKVPSPQNEGRTVQDAKIAELKILLAS